MKIRIISKNQKTYYFIPKKFIIKINPNYTEFIKKEQITIHFN